MAVIAPRVVCLCLVLFATLATGASHTTLADSGGSVSIKLSNGALAHTPGQRNGLDAG
jgi:hypothetical protein